MRELPLRCTIRLWDTYQVQGLPLPSLLYWSLWGQFHRTFVATWVTGGPVGRGCLGSSSGAAGADPEFCCPQSEPEGFSHFHLYVCAAFLIKWRKEILDEEDFQVSPWGWGRFPGGRGEGIAPVVRPTWMQSSVISKDLCLKVTCEAQCSGQRPGPVRVQTANQSLRFDHGKSLGLCVLVFSCNTAVAPVVSRGLGYLRCFTHSDRDTSTS